ncbi:zinc ribbon domain-containing protein [Thermophilibacter immobilis]|jgi:predicted  nucleic acid-binding Zn-ribbon protein|uniref:C4-type zinc ribbon domain-containing protein n=1 Tax=Thermophilibacter immobilis TaxID=2779519 RepID=A0A7S7M749_9ACTN|nr:C4-type zinc ribbon domain-containing protein [Thermophilibacter immobilis]QOY59833.1 hypothetical protein INP52_05125 [Thermophilibacter immobilis]
MSEAEALMNLQDLDLRLLRSASTLASMPQQKRLKTIALARKKVTSELTRIVGQRKDAQIDIDDAEAALAHYRERTAEVQLAAEAEALTHRELAGFEQQLTSLAKRVEKCAFSLPSLRERLGRLERAEENARLTLEKLDAQAAVTQEALDEGSAGLRAQIVTLSRERAAEAALLSSEHLASYEVARKRFGGLAVERLHGNVPTVCRVKLQPSQFHDLMVGDEITTCPYCHRMLVTSEGVEGA